MNEDTNIADPNNCWRDYLLAQRTVARVMGQMPIVAGVTVATYMLNDSEWGWSMLVLFLMQCGLWAALCLTTVVESAKEEGFKVAEQSLHSYFSVFCLYFITSIASTLGLAVFVLPGFWITAVTAVAIVVCCVETKGAVASFRESIALSRGHFGYLMRYLGVPTLVVVAFPIMVGMYVASVFEHIEFAERLILNGFGVLLGWSTLCMLPLQVKSYKRLRELKAGASRELASGKQILLSTVHAADAVEDDQSEIINTKKFEQA